MSTGWSGPARLAELSDLDVHGFLQLLAGWVPDSELGRARRDLADGKSAASAAAAAAMAADYEVPLLAPGLEAGRALAGEPGVLDDVRPVPRYPRLPFRFSASGPDERLGHDDVDEVVIEVARSSGARISGLWRTWRFPPADDGQEADLRPTAANDPARVHRVYIVQVTDGALAPAVAGAVHAALDGVAEAGVEVIDPDIEPPPYQAAALARSAQQLWAAGAGSAPPFWLARVFDFADPVTGPGFALGHRVIADDDERDRMVRFLKSGTIILHIPARMTDVLKPDNGQVVPTTFRSDGEWIWTDAVTYYLEYYRLAPDEGLMEHIDARCPAAGLDSQTGYETAVEAADFLLRPYRLA
jgi:hypothetical protein